ncbi:MAG TPA: hypothetical protein VH575_07300 [Gemmataceae bacterium]|jgi:hypothetical protein
MRAPLRVSRFPANGGNFTAVLHSKTIDGKYVNASSVRPKRLRGNLWRKKCWDTERPELLLKEPAYDPAFSREIT